MNKLDVSKELGRISDRLDSLEALRNHDIEEASAHHVEIADHLKKIDHYIDKQINFKEFKANHTRNLKQNILIFGALISTIVALTGWSFWEKGLYTPVPDKQNFTVNQR